MIEESQSEIQTLFLLDEIFKGTNTVERIAAGKAVLSYLNKGQHIVFVSTHDIELTDYLKDSFDLYHFTEVVEDDKIAFDYKLKEGNLKTRNAIRILELNQYPIEVINEAKILSEKITNTMANMD
jgi:DNA mismatch repair ATPase MutS